VFVDSDRFEPVMIPTPGSSHHRVIIFNGGDPLPRQIRRELPLGAFTIAADSGVEHALALEWPIDLAVGDFDSVSPSSRSVWSLATGWRSTVAKDHTDLELALDAAMSLGPDEIVVVGGHGGRVDHFLAAALVLTRDAYDAAAIRAIVGPARLHVVRRRVDVLGRPGDLLSLLAIAGPATGVTTEGLRYPLRDEPLWPGSTRGVSNELTDDSASVTVASGVLLAVHTPT
jgi:thiamine pyrophosphokinase